MKSKTATKDNSENEQLETANSENNNSEKEQVEGTKYFWKGQLRTHAILKRDKQENDSSRIGKT